MENKIYGYVYLITNLINGKQYVGQTVETIEIRFSGHCSKRIPVISRAIRKYGRENFMVQELAVAYNQEELTFLEGLYISWFNTLKPNGYNIKKIIDGKGKHSKETKEKLKKIANKPERLKLQSETGRKSRGRKIGGKSKYCGVSTKQNRYVSVIGFNNKTVHIGYYNLEEDAAKAYDIKALELFGKNAKLNFSELREKYLNNEIIMNKNTSKSGIKGIYFHSKSNRWILKWLNKQTNKYKEKSFKTLEEAKLFKSLNLL